MTGHVPPERFAGELTLDEAAHANACAACQAARGRVTRARRDDVDRRGRRAGVELGSARDALYWATSSEMRRREREQEQRRGWARRWAPLVLAGFAVAGSVAAIVVVRTGRLVAQKVTPPRPMKSLAELLPATPPAPSPSTAPVPAEPPAAPLAGMVTLLQGDASIDSHPAAATADLVPGAVLVTGDGRVAVQFGERSGFVLEPHSRAELVAFDERTIDVKLSGTIAVELGHRRPDQRFRVLCGTRAVEVRGTIFRVAEHAGDVDVAVARGRVAVIDGTETVEVAAGAELAVAAAARLGSLTPRPFVNDDTGALARGMRVPMVAYGSTAPWSAQAARQSSALLLVEASPRADVRIDGVAVGAGSLVMRAPAGRHLIESGRAASRWVEVEAGESTHAQVAAAAAAGTGASERPGQLDAQLEAHRAELTRCGDAMRKLDPDFQGEIKVEIGIGADGSVASVAPVNSVLDSRTEACVLDAIRDRFVFPAGTPATVQKKLRF